MQLYEVRNIQRERMAVNMVKDSWSVSSLAAVGEQVGCIGLSGTPSTPHPHTAPYSLVSIACSHIISHSLLFAQTQNHLHVSHSDSSHRVSLAFLLNWCVHVSHSDSSHRVSLAFLLNWCVHVSHSDSSHRVSLTFLLNWCGEFAT